MTIAQMHVTWERLRTVAGNQTRGTDASMYQVSLVNLYLLRVMYLLIAFVMGSEQWTLLVEIGPQRSLMQGVAHSMLAALAAACVMGLWRPLQMLPLLFFEFGWKITWLTTIALRLAMENRLPDNFVETVWACLVGMIIPLIIPWRYVYAEYVKRPSDRLW